MSRAATEDGEAVLRAYVDSLAARARPVRVVEKRGVWHQTLADRALRVLTLNGQRRYLSHYVTTLGHTIYVPETWSAWPAWDRYLVLRHELVHVAQFERWTAPGMVLLYGLLPFPVGLAWCRARLEWEAYAETLRVTAEVYGRDAAWDPSLHDEIVGRFTGPDYAWMWPFERAVRRWIADCLASLDDDARR